MDILLVGGGDVATFKYNVIDEAPFSIHDLEFLPLPGIVRFNTKKNLQSHDKTLNVYYFQFTTVYIYQLESPTGATDSRWEI